MIYQKSFSLISVKIYDFLLGKMHFIDNGGYQIVNYFTNALLNNIR